MDKQHCERGRHQIRRAHAAQATLLLARSTAARRTSGGGLALKGTHAYSIKIPSAHTLSFDGYSFMTHEVERAAPADGVSSWHGRNLR